MKHLKFTIGVTFLLLLIGCGSEEKSGESGEANDIGEGYSEENSADNDSIAEEINMLIQMIPSPVEMASALHSSGSEFDETLLNPTEQVEGYSTSHQKAIALGVYGADLGYINLYHETIRSLNYVGNIVQLSQDLKVSQFFDFTTLKRLATEHDDLDSLLTITTTGFSNMNNYLRDQKRSNISALIALGAWTEGIYILSSTYSKTQNQELAEKIAEQKMLIPEFQKVVQAFPRLEYAEEFNLAFDNLNREFEDVTMEFGGGEVVMKEVDGEVVFEQTSESVVEFSEETMNAIVGHVQKLRNQVVKK